MKSRTSRCHSIRDLRRAARRTLPLPVFDYLDGGAEDERALIAAETGFDRYKLVPRPLVDVSGMSGEVRLFGRTVPYPLMLSPTGLTRLFHRDAELAVARAASRLGLPYCLSTMGTTTVEAFASVQTAPRLFQLYIFKDRGLTRELLDRVAAEAYDGIVLTVDTVVAGRRRRDIRNGLSLPPRLTLRGFLGFACRPTWSIPALLGTKFEFANLAHRAEALDGRSTALQDYVAAQFDRSLTWRDVEWLRAQWPHSLTVKGILHPDDAEQAVAAGADTIMVSNHGGRQLDAAPAPIDCIAPIAERVGGRARIICDGGVRRGSDIVSALALGADACSIGRPYLYGLAAGGADGVQRALDLLIAEFETAMILTGAPDVGHARASVLPGLSFG